MRFKIALTLLALAVFVQAVGLFAFFGLSVALLSLPVSFPAAGITTAITTVSLATPATPAYTKSGFAPTTSYLNQFQHPALQTTGV